MDTLIVVFQIFISVMAALVIILNGFKIDPRDF